MPNNSVNTYTGFNSYCYPLSVGLNTVNITVVSTLDASATQTNSLNITKPPVIVLPSKPLAPSGVSVLAGDTQATISWNSDNTATSYTIYRSTHSGSGYTLIGSTITSSYKDTNLTNGTTYYYVITATNQGGESAYSNEVSAKPEPIWILM